MRQNKNKRRDTGVNNEASFYSWVPTKRETWTKPVQKSPTKHKERREGTHARSFWQYFSADELDTE